MRAVLRSLSLVILFACATSEASAQPVPGGGLNALSFQSGSPAPRPGGVEVSVTQKPAPEFTCKRLFFRVIDNVTGETLATHSIDDPPESVTTSFLELGNNRQILVVVTATFAKGDVLDTKRVTAEVTTR